VIIRRELATDVPAIRAVTAAAFATAAHSAPPVEPDGVPGEATLVGWLRNDPGWLPSLSLVAESPDGQIVGHVVCTRGSIDGAPVLGLGPISVDPGHQGAGVGSALVHAVLAAADALDEPLVALLGDPGYYGRFGFRPDPALTGTFTYAAPFSRF
jgi:putative acetyltransferase